ncbi:unnamed protein product [Caretta caretta]
MTAPLTAERPELAYWHFDNSLLEDVGFVASFREFWLAWHGRADRVVLLHVLAHSRTRPCLCLGRVLREQGLLSVMQAGCAHLVSEEGGIRVLQNWRPVSLLSMDYKDVAKAILLRLRSVLADVVHPNQTYTVPGCSIFDNLYLVRDLLECGCRDGLSFAFLSLDQEKAFNRVNHGYLLGTLWVFSFGTQFVGFLQVLYTSTEYLVKLNWTLADLASGEG